MERQGQEPSCAAASIVTLVNTAFGLQLKEGEVWLQYLKTLPLEEQELALDKGLSLFDISRIVEGLGFRAHVVSISLLDLDRVGQPAIVYLERGEPRPFRHLVVFDGIDGTRVKLRDPALGNRRIHVERFVEEWQGRYAVFITRP